MTALDLTIRLQLPTPARLAEIRELQASDHPDVRSLAGLAISLSEQLLALADQIGGVCQFAADNDGARIIPDGSVVQIQTGQIQAEQTGENAEKNGIPVSGGNTRLSPGLADAKRLTTK